MSLHKNVSTHCHPGSNKIMNNNIIQKNQRPIQDPNLPNNIHGIANGGLGQTSGFGYFQSEQDYFGDFEQKFLDAKISDTKVHGPHIHERVAILSGIETNTTYLDSKSSAQNASTVYCM